MTPNKRPLLMTALYVGVFSFLALHVRAETALEALRATVRLTDGQKGGTAFIVAVEGKPGARQHLLVTAAHVFKDLKPPACTLVFRALDDKGVSVRKEVQVALLEKEKPRWVSHLEADVAVMAVELPKDADIQPLELEQVATPAFAEDGRFHVGQEVWIPCFPARTEANAAGWPLLRKGMIATHPLKPLAKAKTFFVDYSHFGGDSGAPVIARIQDKTIVVGLVTRMQRQEDRITTPFEEKTVYMPLDLAVTAQAPFLRETVSLWRKQNVSP